MVGLVDDDTVFGGLLDLGDNNGAFIAVGVVEVDEILEGELAGNIRVEDEKGRVVLAKDVLGELQRTGSAERFWLEREVDLDAACCLVLSDDSWSARYAPRVVSG